MFFLVPKYESKTSSMWKKLEKIEPAPIMFVFLSAKLLANESGIDFVLSVSQKEYSFDSLCLSNADVVLGI